MSTTELQPAPKLAEFEATNDKWQQEYQAFLRLKPRLLENYRGQYVAIHEGQVVGSGPDQIAVAVQAYDAFGYGPI